MTEDMELVLRNLALKTVELRVACPISTSTSARARGCSAGPVRRCRYGGLASGRPRL